MSAMFLDKLHIDVLVSVVIDLCSETRMGHDRYRATVTAHNARAVGQMLWAQNARSVSHLYRDDPSYAQCLNEIVACYGFEYRPRLDPTLAAKALEAYEYQACETTDYETTPACDFVSRLARRLVKRMPSYERAPWCVDTIEQLRFQSGLPNPSHRQTPGSHRCRSRSRITRSSMPQRRTRRSSPSAILMADMSFWLRSSGR